jgi:hypothetical protein
MIVSFQKTVRAITEAVLWEWIGPDSVTSAGPVAEFVMAQHSRMPDYLRLPLMSLTLLCDSWPVWLGFGRPLHGLPMDQRCRVLAAWKRSRVGFRRKLIKFYESLVVFGWAAEYQDHRDG